MDRSSVVTENATAVRDGNYPWRLASVEPKQESVNVQGLARGAGRVEERFEMIFDVFESCAAVFDQRLAPDIGVLLQRPVDLVIVFRIAAGGSCAQRRG